MKIRSISGASRLKLSIGSLMTPVSFILLHIPVERKMSRVLDSLAVIRVEIKVID